MEASAIKSAKSRSLSLTYRAIQQAAALIVLYVILLFVLPIGKDALNAYHMTMFEYRIIRFAIAIPVLLVWLAAFTGFSTLRQYAGSLSQTAEGEHFERLATGCAWLAWSLPITALTSLILGSLASKAPGFQGTSVIVTNYVNLLLPLVAFSIIGIASRGLVSQANLKISLASAQIIILLFLTAGVLYCYLTFSHFNLSDIGSTHNPYHLPIWLMAISVIIPYLYAWFVGLLAAYEITLLSKQVRGLLYRRSLQWLIGGLATIIVSSIASQYVSGVSPVGGHLIFDFKLVMIVLFRILGGAGFLALTYGALKLKKIEEV